MIQNNSRRILIQIPSKNEEDNIELVLQAINQGSDGVKIDVLVIDDASSDQTIRLSISNGATFVIHKEGHLGLANSFSLGATFAIANGYDVLVNTDGDNQYYQEKIPDLVRPIIEGKAELVIGDRVIDDLEHFSWGKRLFQKFGSGVVSVVAGQKINDAASGFRAYSVDLLARLNVTTKFSYAMETLIQSAHSDARIVSIPTGAKQVDRPSRLFKSSREHVWKSAQAILRGLVSYRPLMTFLSLSAILLVIAMVPFVRYMFLSLSGTPGDHIQSLILGVIFFIGSFTAATLAILSDSIKSQRIIIERQFALQRLSLKPSDTEAILKLYGARLVHSGKELGS